jgi:hypothetical protein
MESQNNNNIKENILQKIKTGKIKMKPKIFFVIKTGFFVMLLLALLFFTVYFVSFIVFMMKVSGLWFLPGFGLDGIRILFGALPWVLILLSLGLIVFSEFFAEHFAFVYKRPMIYSLSAIVLIVIISGMVTAQTSMHAGIFQKASENNFPLIKPFYDQVSNIRPQNMHTGIISEINELDFNIQTLNGQNFKVIPCKNGRGKTPKILSAGERVVIIGPVKNNIIDCLNILKIADDGSLTPIFKMKRMGNFPGGMMQNQLR